MLLDVRPDHLQIVQAILQKHVPQYAVWAFGSRAKWTAKDYSDLDLCVVSDKPLDFRVLGALAEDFSESDLPWKVDVVDWATTSESFRKIIERDKVVVQDRSDSWGMPSEVRPLRELCSLIADCPHSTPVWTDSGHIVIRNQNIKNGRLDLSAPSFTDAEHFAHRTRRAKPAAGDIIFTREAPMGEVCMIPKGLECCVGQRQVLLRPNPAVVDGTYLLYALQSPQVQHEIGWNEGTGSTVSNVRIPVLEALRIPTPSIAEQREVAGVLGALDDKIALLRETNATLEAIAQALFKSWFVDFDPVRAKAEGRDPIGIPSEVADLFPSEFEDSELGGIPKGWRVGTLQDLLVLQRGFDLPAQARTPGAYPIIAASGPCGTHVEAMAKGPGVVTGRSGVLGKVFLELEDYWPLNTTLWVKEFKTATPCYAFEVLKRLDFQSYNAGSAVPTLNRNHIHGLAYLVPNQECVNAFEEIAFMLHQRVRENDKHADSLIVLRDTLLPRLMSGKLRIPKAGALQ